MQPGAHVGAAAEVFGWAQPATEEPSHAEAPEQPYDLVRGRDRVRARARVRVGVRARIRARVTVRVRVTVTVRARVSVRVRADARRPLCVTVRQIYSL